jgi:hypothetical protein
MLRKITLVAAVAAALLLPVPAFAGHGHGSHGWHSGHGWRGGSVGAAEMRGKGHAIPLFGVGEFSSRSLRPISMRPFGASTAL